MTAYNQMKKLPFTNPLRLTIPETKAAIGAQLQAKQWQKEKNRRGWMGNIQAFSITSVLSPELSTINIFKVQHKPPCLEATHPSISTNYSQEPRKHKKPLGPHLCFRGLALCRRAPWALTQWPYLESRFRSTSNRFICFFST